MSVHRGQSWRHNRGQSLESSWKWNNWSSFPWPVPNGNKYDGWPSWSQSMFNTSWWKVYISLHGNTWLQRTDAHWWWLTIYRPIQQEHIGITLMPRANTQMVFAGLWSSMIHKIHTGESTAKNWHWQSQSKFLIITWLKIWRITVWEAGSGLRCLQC